MMNRRVVFMVTDGAGNVIKEGGIGDVLKTLNGVQDMLKKQEAPANEGLLDWLLSCPVKGWFQPLASESTATL